MTTPNAYACAYAHAWLQPHSMQLQLHYIRLQPPLHTVTASITYGCSLHHIRLQAAPKKKPRAAPPGAGLPRTLLGLGVGVGLGLGRGLVPMPARTLLTHV